MLQIPLYQYFYQIRVISATVEEADNIYESFALSYFQYYQVHFFPIHLQVDILKNEDTLSFKMEQISRPVFAVKLTNQKITIFESINFPLIELISKNYENFLICA